VASDPDGICGIQIWTLDAMLQDFGDEHKESESDSIDIRFDTNDLPDGDTQIFVRICDCDGNCTDSDIINYKIDNTISKPEKVGITKAEYVTGGFRIEWEKSVSEDFFQYDLYHSLDPSLEVLNNIYSTNSVDGNSFLFTNEKQEDRFANNYFYATVTDTFNYSSNSDTASAIMLPDTINILSKEFFNDGFQLKWSQSSSVDFNKYELYHSLDENLIFSENPIATFTSIEDTMFTFINPDQENIYNYNYFYVKADDTYNYATISDTVSAVLLYESVLLDSINANGNSLSLKWSESEDQYFASYNLYVASDQEMTDKEIIFSSLNRIDTNYLSSDYTYGQTYFFQVGTMNIWSLETLSNIQSISPVQITFSNNYDYNSSNDVGYFGLQNAENRYLILASNSEDLILLFDDERGSNVEYINMNYGSFETGTELKMMNEDEFFILSNVLNNDTDHDIRLTKVNSIGGSLWNTVYGSDGLDNAEDINFTTNNEILITGTFDPEPGRNRRELWVLKTNSNGTIQFDISLAFEDDFSQGNAICEVDFGFVVLGNTEKKNEPNNRNIWFVKFDDSNLENIDTLWTKSLSIEDYDYPSGLIALNDGTLLAAGYSTSNSSGISEKAWLIKINQDGMNETIYTFPGEKYFYSVIQSTDGDFILAGMKEVDSNMQAWIVCIDAFGVLLWENTFGTEAEDHFMSVSQTNDGGYILTGTSKVETGNSDIFYVKTDANGNIN